MRKGERLEGSQFYSELFSDGEFCKHLGKSILAAGRLEACLAKHITANAPGENIYKATLGKLIKITEKHELLPGIIPILKILSTQRNYLIHNIYSLFSGLIEETILPKADLLDSDIDIFTDKAKGLAEDLNDMAELVESNQILR